MYLVLKAVTGGGDEVLSVWATRSDADEEAKATPGARVHKVIAGKKERPEVAPRALGRAA